MKNQRTRWDWYRPIDRVLERVLKVYMTIEVWGVALFGGLLLLLWLIKVGLEGDGS